MEPMIVAGILFVITYGLLLALPNHRAVVALGGGVAFIVFGLLPLTAVPGAVDWNVLLMIGGTMGLVELFIASGMPSLLSYWLLQKIHTVRSAVVALALFAGLISAFIDNVATVLMVAPVAMAVAKRAKISPVPVIISIAVSSNLQGAATLVGDTTSILLGAAADMNFMDFFWYQGRPGIFWVVQAGAVVSALILFWLFRKEKSTIESGEKPVVNDYFPTVLLVGMVVLLAGASLLPNTPAMINGIICSSLMVIGQAWYMLRGKKQIVVRSLKAIDFQTLALLAGVFLVVAGVEAAGMLDWISARFATLGGGSMLLVYTAVVWVSVACSAFIDNIPYVAAMLPVTAQVSALLGADPTLLYFGLLVGATLGGNLTPVGASANITGIGILRREGHQVANKDFLRIGVPFTLAAVGSGYILLWLLWA